MPERPRRKPVPRTRTRDVYTEADGLFGRLTDIVIENPARSGGVVLILMVFGAIVSNAAFLQTAHHPDPFFSTRPQVDAPPARAAAVVTPSTPAANAAVTAKAVATAIMGGDSDTDAASSMPLPKSRVPNAPSPPPSPSLASKPASVPTLAPQGTTLVFDTQKALALIQFYDGPIDGLTGPQTKAAISAFEMKIGLIPTGQPSLRLLGQIRKGYPPHRSADPGSTGSIDDPATRARVTRVQRALNDIGYGPVPVDGHGGGKTANAIRRFELDNGLPVSGSVSDIVIAKMVRIGALKNP